MKHLKTLAAALAMIAAPAVFAAGSMDGMDMKAPAASQQAPRPVPAEIKKIDAQTGKVTLKHGPIENLGMPGMTMAFPVKDRASLSQFKEGEAVSVTFDKVDGAPTVVDMQRK
ncbi:copper-binding protein [Cupriavidus nantongensis]|uniref:copper-binding protein n=1 Tax=Cupriavidus nantongensis TaxID=1796606 RepID=UPI002246F033|nr:copper-binding protein [Cupriavidus nantongensis]